MQSSSLTPSSIVPTNSRSGFSGSPGVVSHRTGWPVPFGKTVAKPSSQPELAELRHRRGDVGALRPGRGSRRRAASGRRRPRGRARSAATTARRRRARLHAAPCPGPRWPHRSRQTGPVAGSVVVVDSARRGRGRGAASGLGAAVVVRARRDRRARRRRSGRSNVSSRPILTRPPFPHGNRRRTSGRPPRPRPARAAAPTAGRWRRCPRPHPRACGPSSRGR